MSSYQVYIDENITASHPQPVPARAARWCRRRPFAGESRDIDVVVHDERALRAPSRSTRADLTVCHVQVHSTCSVGVSGAPISPVPPSPSHTGRADTCFERRDPCRGPIWKAIPSQYGIPRVADCHDGGSEETCTQHTVQAQSIGPFHSVHTGTRT
jgi:hypothetical protein